MTELSNDESLADGGGDGDQPGEVRPVERTGRAQHGGPAGHGGRPVAAAVVLGALGVAFGDIGTSPLYAVQTVFSIDGGAVHPNADDVLGVASLIFWSVTLVVSLKYVTLLLRADNEGEGGVMALSALVRRLLDGGVTARRIAVVMTLGVLGASLFSGESVITPAISVLSAVEGLKVVAPDLKDAVVPAALVIIALLFAGQRWGTGRVGRLFGPVMLVWFAVLAVSGLAEVLRSPTILRGLSPTYALAFVADRPYVAFVAFGAVVLAITGAEALYADMGHFGRSAIRWAWFLLVFPALVLNYLGQAALVLRDPSGRANTFYLLMPGWAQIPVLLLATLATVIASQAVISGAYSVCQQALRLGFLPHLRIRHTSKEEAGQIYVPSVNWLLCIAVLVVTVAFGSSARLASAYGVAVTGTLLITTTLLLTVAKTSWHWRTWQLVLAGVVFYALEVTFFAANIVKVVSGGWLTLLLAASVFTVMLTWQRGRQIVTKRRIEMEGPLPDFVADVHARRIQRVPGTAVFPHPTKETTPLALRANVEHNKVLHERIVIISGRTANLPHVPWSERLTVDDLGDPDDGIVHVEAVFGFDDPTDFTEVLREVHAQRLGGAEELVVDPENASYFVSRITLRRTKRPGMIGWRKALFLALAHNAASQVEFLGLPDERTVVMGGNVDL